MKLKLPYMFLLLSILVITGSPGVAAQEVKTELPKEKQTSLALYVTAKEAYDMWKANHANVKILDVRTNEEYLFVGHPNMAWNIPLLFQSYEWDTEKQRFPMKLNPDFISKVKRVTGTNDTILVICRSGGRSAMAVNQLAEAGFKNVYNITDGVEGDAIDDAQSLFNGQRLKNGWKNSGLPWTYKIDPKLMLIPGAK